MSASTLSGDETKALTTFKNRLLASHAKEVVALKLFGSKARGDGHSESDVDVLVVVTKRTRLLNDFIIDLVCDIINSTGVFLEVVTYSREEFENAQEIEHPFAQNIARESVPL